VSEYLTIRHATPADIPILVGIERSSPTAAHWTEQRYRRAIESGEEQRVVLVLEESASPRAIVGFLIARQIAPEWELENIVVAAHAQRNGHGKRLLQSLLAHAGDTHSTQVFLEVRESNLAARKLYETLGFQEGGRRKSYYHNLLEDAILYACIVE
jgi:[ribosomal protein S18]-alanine N-acetyltransferase